MIGLLIVALIGAVLVIVVLVVLLVAALLFIARGGNEADGDRDSYDTDAAHTNPIFMPDDGPADDCDCEDCADERESEDPARAYVESVLDVACDDMASYYAAVRLGADEATCELWRARVYRGLRERLDDDQRLAAIVLLLSGDAREAADELAVPEGVERG